MISALKSIVKKILLSFYFMTPCLAMEQPYIPFELNLTENEKNFGNLGLLKPDCRQCVYQLLSKNDCVSFAQANKAFYSEIQFFITPPNLFDLDTISPEIIAWGLQGKYKNFKGTLQLKNAKAKHLPIILPHCKDVLCLDLSESNIGGFIDEVNTKTALQYISTLKLLNSLQTLHISGITLDGNWGILPILKSSCLMQLHTLNWTNCHIHDSFKTTILKLKILNLSESSMSSNVFAEIVQSPAFQELEELNLARTVNLDGYAPINHDLSILLKCENDSCKFLPVLKKLFLSSPVTKPLGLEEIRPNLEIVLVL